MVESVRKVVTPYPPGSEIVLADGTRGSCVGPVGALDRRLVRLLADEQGRPLEPVEVDLSECPLLAPALEAA